MKLALALILYSRDGQANSVFILVFDQSSIHCALCMCVYSMCVRERERERERDREEEDRETSFVA